MASQKTKSETMKRNEPIPRAGWENANLVNFLALWIFTRYKDCFNKIKKKLKPLNVILREQGLQFTVRVGIILGCVLFHSWIEMYEFSLQPHFSIWYPPSLPLLFHLPTPFIPARPEWTKKISHFLKRYRYNVRHFNCLS